MMEGEMKKKLLVVFFVVLMALGTVFGAVACQKDPEEPDKDGFGGDTEVVTPEKPDSDENGGDWTIVVPFA